MNRFTSLVSYKLALVAIGLLSVVGVGFSPLPANVSAHPLLQSTTVTSSRSGKWSDPAVWSNGVIPQAGDAVLIRKGDTVVYDAASDAVFDQLTINGVLYFSREVNTRLRLKSHLLVQAGGYLNMGTPTDYLPPNIKAELTFVLTEAQANAFTGTSNNDQDKSHQHGGSDFNSPDIGLWVFERGRWDLHGSPLLRSWSKLAGDALAGAITLTVENNVGDWYAGGRIVVTSTRNPTQYYVRESDGREMTKTTVEHEMRTIQALEVLDNGQTRITLDRPLSFTHSGTAPFRGEVALLTRNVVVSTEITGVDNFDDVRTRKFAHTMYMEGAKGNLEYGEFRRLGHYGVRARYAIHHHRMLNTSQGIVVRGNAMWQTGFRCLNLHITYGVLVEDNVCYDSASTAFFVEEDDRPESDRKGKGRGYNQDNVFVHNIAIATKPKHFDDRNSDTIGGESRRTAAFWPGSETQNEVFLGNVAVGGYEYGDSAGFVFPENGNEVNSQGKIPFTFVHNEVHSSAMHGIFSWQNVSAQRDMVDTLIWRNGNAGIRWGAYRTPSYYFNTQLLENGRSGLEITSVNPFLQDSVIAGSTADGSKQDWGFAITGYVIPQYPNPGAWIVRNQFRNLQTSGVSQLQHPVAYDNMSGNECETHNYDSNAPYDLKQRPVQAGECSGIYITLMGNQFENVARPLIFGKAANPNSWWKVFDYSRDGLPSDDFVVVRSDLTQSDKQGIITRKLVTDQAQYNAELDALVVPMSSLDLGGIQFNGLLNHRNAREQGRSPSPDFTFKTQPDYPPTVTLDVTTAGQSVTMRATAADDFGVTRVEFFVDWTKVATKTPPAGTTMTEPYEVTVDLTNHPRKYAYLYVRVFDGTQQFGSYPQRAYSKVVEIGPETLGIPEIGTYSSWDAPVDLGDQLYLPALHGS